MVRSTGNLSSAFNSRLQVLCLRSAEVPCIPLLRIPCLTDLMKAVTLLKSMCLFRPQVKIWFQNRRYKTKRKQLHQQEQQLNGALSSGVMASLVPRKVAVRVLVKDGRMTNTSDDVIRPLLYPSVPIAGLAYWPYPVYS